MAALTGRAANFDSRDDKSQEFLVATSSVIYWGALVGIDVTTGTLFPWHSDANLRFCGIVLAIPPATVHSVTGDGTKKVTVYTGGFVLRNVAVAGVDAADDEGDAVYCTTDNFEDLTLTDPATCPEIGNVFNVDTTNGRGDVHLYPLHSSIRIT